MTHLLQAAKETLSISANTLPIIGLSLLAVELLSFYGLLKKVQYLFKPLVRIARLPSVAGPALATAVGSALAADTLVAVHVRQGRLDRRKGLLAAQANTLPSYFTETLTYMLPVMLPALGHPVGWYYLSASFIMSWIHFSGYLARLANYIGPALQWVGLEESLFLPVLGYIASPMTTSAAVGALYKTSAVTAQAATTAALVGSLISLPFFALRYSLARNISIFGPTLGTANVIVSVSIGMFTRLSVLIFVPILYNYRF